jgi:hypothetical protein
LPSTPQGPQSDSAPCEPCEPYTPALRADQNPSPGSLDATLSTALIISPCPMRLNKRQGVFYGLGTISFSRPSQSSAERGNAKTATPHSEGSHESCCTGLGVGSVWTGERRHNACFWRGYAMIRRFFRGPSNIGGGTARRRWFRWGHGGEIRNGLSFLMGESEGMFGRTQAFPNGLGKRNN